MRYSRTYTMDQIHRLLYESEGRASPKSGQDGHSINLHADMRSDMTDKRAKRTILLAETIEQSRAMSPADAFRIENNHSPGIESRFTSRKDMILAVQQAINSGAGQNELAKFDANSSLPRVTIKATLNPPRRNIERFTKSTGSLERGLSAQKVLVIVDRRPAGEIHIQTAFPLDVS